MGDSNSLPRWLDPSVAEGTNSALPSGGCVSAAPLLRLCPGAGGFEVCPFLPIVLQRIEFKEEMMTLVHILFAMAIMTAPAAAFAQDSTITPSMTEPRVGGCSVAGSAGCLAAPSGAQPNTSPDSSLEGGAAGGGSESGGASGTLENTSPGSTLNPGDSSGGSGGTSGGSGAAGPLGNTSPN